MKKKILKVGSLLWFPEQQTFAIVSFVSEERLAGFSIRLEEGSKESWSWDCSRTLYINKDYPSRIIY